MPPTTIRSIRKPALNVSGTACSVTTVNHVGNRHYDSLRRIARMLAKNHGEKGWSTQTKDQAGLRPHLPQTNGHSQWTCTCLVFSIRSVTWKPPPTPHSLGSG